MDCYLTLEVRILVKNINDEASARIAAALAVHQGRDTVILPSHRAPVTIEVKGLDVLACTPD